MIGFDFPDSDREEGRRHGRGRFAGHGHHHGHHHHGHRHGRPGSDDAPEASFDGQGNPGEWPLPWLMRAWFGRGFARRGGWPGAEARNGTDHPHAGGEMFAGGRGWPPHGRFPHEHMFGRGFGGPRGPGRPGRPGRPLGQGDLRWLVLDLIAAQPRHGYEIIKAIEEALNGHYTPSPGVIYPTLTLLEETGLISGEAHGAKKLYSLTEEGRAEVEAHAADIQAVRERIADARARFGAVPPPELFRAMDNLRAALQVRLAKGELSPEAVQAMTAAIDRAAAEIERS